MNWKEFWKKAEAEWKRFLDRLNPAPEPTPEPEPTPVDPTPTPSPEPMPEPTPEPEEPAQEPTGGTLLPSQVKWLTARGKNYANAKTVLEISSASMAGTHLNFKTSKAIPWPKRGSKNVDAVGFLIRKVNGVYVGGKTEWVVSSRGWYDIKTNTADGYNGHTMPAKGETCWAGLGHPDNGSECSTLVPFSWAG